MNGARREGRPEHRVLEAILQCPGIHKSELQRKLGLGWGTVSYHVQVLRRRGHIVVRTKGREAHLFATAVSNEQMAWLTAARKPLYASILEQLKSSPGLRASELAKALGRTPNPVRRHLKVMAALGMVSCRGTYAREFYCAEEAPSSIRHFLDHQGLPGPLPAAAALDVPAARRSHDGKSRREGILEAVLRTPGIHASELARVTGTSWGNLAHHLHILEREGALAKWLQGRYAYYFPTSVPPSDWAGLVAVQQGLRDKVLQAVEDTEGMRLEALARVTGTDVRVVRRLVDRLVSDGLLQPAGPLGGRSASAMPDAGAEPLALLGP